MKWVGSGLPARRVEIPAPRKLPVRVRRLRLDSAGVQLGDFRERVEITVPMRELEVVSKGAGSDQTIDARSNGDSCAPGIPVKIHGVLEDRGGQRLATICMVNIAREPTGAGSRFTPDFVRS